MDQPRIRPGKQHNFNALGRVARQTFREAFGGQNNPADMEKYMAENLTDKHFELELADNQNKFFLSILGQEIIGYAKLRDRASPDQPPNVKAIELERIYVLGRYQNKKVGNDLMAHCIDFAMKAGFQTLWLGVWERNAKAIGFYQRWGFEPYGKHAFTLGNDVQTDVLMKKELVANLTL
jgi:diamine N-acetyltransferase